MKRRQFLTASAATATATAILRSPQAASAQVETPDPAGVAGYRYRLPSFPVGSRLLFQGDSITDMKWGRNEKDRNHYLGHSYVYLIAARLGVDLPEAKLDIYNRGMSGHRVEDLKKRWQEDAIDMRPDLLSILIGINDVSRGGGTIEQWEVDYRGLLKRSRAANAALRLVLLDPFVLVSGRLKDEAKWLEWRAKVDAMRAIVARLAEEFDAVHIKTQEIFDTAAAQVSPEHWIWDGVHPLPQGHELIARNWLQEVSARWNKTNP
ncbi:MAG: SGNH/GDSL hydrolase family protein [Verrucomicrobiales bacterium]